MDPSMFSPQCTKSLDTRSADRPSGLQRYCLCLSWQQRSWIACCCCCSWSYRGSKQDGVTDESKSGLHIQEKLEEAFENKSLILLLIFCIYSSILCMWVISLSQRCYFRGQSSSSTSQSLCFNILSVEAVVSLVVVVVREGRGGGDREGNF